MPGAPAEIAGTREAIPAMRQVVEGFRRHRRPIIHVVRLYLPDGSNVDRARRGLVTGGQRLVAPGTSGAELAEELKRDASVTLDAERCCAASCRPSARPRGSCTNRGGGAFYDTPLLDFLGQLGLDSPVVCGCNFPNCPRTTVYEASERDFRVALVTDATSGLYERGEAELASIGVHLFTARECAQWAAGRPQHRTW